MQFQRICLAHYHELGLKGHNRTLFEKKLMYNLQALLDRPCVEKVIRISGRILVIFVHDATEEDAESTVSLIARVPGVARVSCGFSCERDIDIMCEAAAQALAEAGEFTMTPAAPCISDTAASCTERLPCVVPPPTPTKTGHSAAVSSACVMAGWAVKG